MIAVVTILSLMGCGNKDNEEEKNPSETTPVETQTEANNGNVNEADLTAEEVVDLLPEETVTEIQESLNNLEISSDKNTISFKQDETTTAVYHHDGEKITGFEAYKEFDSVELALAAEAEAKADPETMEDVESIKVEGNKVHVVFKASAYEGTTLEEVQQAVALIQAIQEAN